MVCSVVLTTALLFLTIHSTQSQIDDYKETTNTSEPNYERYENRQASYNDVHNEASGVSKTTNERNQQHAAYFHKHEEVSRVIRSDNTTFDVNGTVVRPDPRLVRNKTISSKKVIDQIHTFFADKAREDAYQKTEAQEHPYSVSYLRYDKKGYVLGICSGTLVTNRWVVTASHCLIDEPVHSVKVFAGVTFSIFKPPKKLSKRSQVRTSYEFFAHPRYDPQSDDADYDVALIKIDPAFSSTRYVTPIRMTSAPWQHEGYRSCVLTAFGSVRDERNSPDDFIRKTQWLEVKKPCDCSSYLEHVLGTAAVRRYICMRPMRDFGICAGDSGGGLVCDGELKAVVSFSIPIEDLSQCRLRGPSGQGECGDMDSFSVWQDLYPSLNWITKNALHVNATSKNNSSEAAKRLNLTTVLCVIMFCLANTSYIH